MKTNAFVCDYGSPNGTRVLYPADHEHTSYSSSSGNGRSFELAWSGVPTAWAGEPDEIGVPSRLLGDPNDGILFVLSENPVSDCLKRNH